MSRWNVTDIPALRGRTAIVTGTGGLGFETALALARAGAFVIVAGRHAGKGTAAVDEIRRRVPQARVSFEALDLASLDSVEALVARVGRTHPSIDLLVNNAGVMTPPQRQQTADGFELQFGTNYLGHVALTLKLLPLLRAGVWPRVVTVSSVAARRGTIDFANLQSERGYVPMTAYAQSKLACLMFSLELHRRSVAAGWGIESLAAHPGIARTDLLPNGAGPRSPAALARRYLWFLFQPAAQGALPILFAATSPGAQAGGYYGPDMLEVRGSPTLARVPSQALDADVAARLWSTSLSLVGMTAVAS